MGYVVGQEREADTAILKYMCMHRLSGQKGNQCVGYGSAAKSASSHLLEALEMPLWLHREQQTVR